ASGAIPYTATPGQGLVDHDASTGLDWTEFTSAFPLGGSQYDYLSDKEYTLPPGLDPAITGGMEDQMYQFGTKRYGTTRVQSTMDPTVTMSPVSIHGGVSGVWENERTSTGWWQDPPLENQIGIASIYAIDDGYPRLDHAGNTFNYISSGALCSFKAPLGEGTWIPYSEVKLNFDLSSRMPIPAGTKIKIHVRAFAIVGIHLMRESGGLPGLKDRTDCWLYYNVPVTLLSKNLAILPGASSLVKNSAMDSLVWQRFHVFEIDSPTLDIPWDETGYYGNYFAPPSGNIVNLLDQCKYDSEEFLYDTKYDSIYLNYGGFYLTSGLGSFNLETIQGSTNLNFKYWYSGNEIRSTKDYLDLGYWSDGYILDDICLGGLFVDEAYIDIVETDAEYKLDDDLDADLVSSDNNILIGVTGPVTESIAVLVDFSSSGL
nr:hypothetical protein [Candidatus Sigynarchaeota archaeon]